MSKFQMNVSQENIFYKHAGKDFTGLVIFKMLAPIFSAAWSYQLYIMFCDIDNIMLTP